MANTLLTPSIIAKEALIVLENNLVLGSKVHRDYADEFTKVGDTITIRKPATFVSYPWDGSSLTVQDIKEKSVSVQLLDSDILDITFKLGTREKTLDLEDFSEQVIQPAMRAHAQKIDELIASLYAYVPYYGLVSGTPAVGDILALDKILNQNKCPVDEQRYGVLSPATKAKYLALEAFLHAEKRGDTDALRRASMGAVFGADWYMDQNIQKHTKGTITTSDYYASVITGDVLKLEAVTSAKTVKKGDIITCNQGAVAVDFVILADADIGTGAFVVVPHYPAVTADVAEGTTAISAVVDTTGPNNLVFHKNAFALIIRPLEKPFSAGLAEVVNYKGLSARLTGTWSASGKSDQLSIDILAKAVKLTEELAVRLIG